MDNKLSELSKPVAWVLGTPSCKHLTADAEYADWYLEHGSTAEPRYSQEYVSALLAELEAKDDALRAIAFHVSAGGYNADSVDAEVFKQKIIDGINGISDVLVKRITELSRLLAHNIERAEEAEAKLATPVRLPDPYQTSCGADELYLCPVEVADAIRAAGFTVGDE